MFKKKLSLLIIGFFLALPLKADRIILKRSAGTMSAGGMVSFPIEWDPAHKTFFTLNLAPEFGIFLFDGFQLLLKPQLKTSFSSQWLALGAESRWRWGLGLGFEYLFEVHWPVVPFVGFNVNYEMAGANLSTARMGLEIPAGILLPLNENVALTFGLSAKVLLIAQLKILDKLRFEPGMLGVKVFF